MKPTVVSADVLFEDHRAQLKWEWVAGLGASERRFDEVAVRAARTATSSKRRSEAPRPASHSHFSCARWSSNRTSALTTVGFTERSGAS